MFCVKCGSALPENAAFCPSCGAKIKPVQGMAKGTGPETAGAQMPETIVQRPRKNGNKIVLISLVSVLCVLTGILVFALTHKGTDAAHSIAAAFSGKNEARLIRTTQNIYGWDGQLTQTTISNYDEHGKRLTVQITEFGQNDSVTEYYDQYGSTIATEQTDADGTTISNEIIWNYTFGENGYPVSATTTNDFGEVINLSEFLFDPQGNLLSRKDYIFDVTYERLTPHPEKTDCYLVHSSENTFYENGAVKTAIDTDFATNSEMRHYYDEMGNLIREETYDYAIASIPTYAYEYEYEYEYDDNGNIISSVAVLYMDEPATEMDVENEFDEDGNLIVSSIICEGWIFRETIYEYE